MGVEQLIALHHHFARSTSPGTKTTFPALPLKPVSLVSAFWMPDAVPQPSWGSTSLTVAPLDKAVQQLLSLFSPGRQQNSELVKPRPSRLLSAKLVDFMGSGSDSKIDLSCRNLRLSRVPILGNKVACQA